MRVCISEVLMVNLPMGSLANTGLVAGLGSPIPTTFSALTLNSYSQPCSRSGTQYSTLPWIFSLLQRIHLTGAASPWLHHHNLPGYNHHHPHHHGYHCHMGTIITMVANPLSSALLPTHHHHHHPHGNQHIIKITMFTIISILTL